MKLTEEQFEKIREAVDAEGLELAPLRDDVIDHLCCVVEIQLQKGMAFDPCLKNAITNLAPNGLAQLQSQTVFLLNRDRVVIMKRALYSVGFISVAIFAAGITMVLMRVSSGNGFFIFGFIATFLFFIPLLIIDRFKVSLSKALSVRVKHIIGALASIITGLSGVFKLMHLQGAGVLLVLGAFLFTFGFLPFYFFTMYKKSVDLN